MNCIRDMREESTAVIIPDDRHYGRITRDSDGSITLQIRESTSQKDGGAHFLVSKKGENR